MQQALDFVRMRIQQLNIDRQVYENLGPVYADQEMKITAVLGELNNLAQAFEVLILVNNADSDKSREL